MSSNNTSANRKYYIVTTKPLIQRFKASKYFKTILGKATTMVKDNGEREVVIDGFIKNYHNKTKCYIYSEGEIGRISFFTNYYMRENIISVYDDTNKFVDLLYEEDYVASISIEKYLLEIMDEFESTHYKEERIEATTNNSSVTNSNEAEEDENYLEGLKSEEVVFKAPYAATWEDVKKYLIQKRGF